MRRILCAAALIGTSVIATVAASPSIALALPSGFTDSAVSQPSGNPLSQPTTIVALPDSRALILEKGGAVRILRADGNISPVDALTLNVCTGSEMGLLGAAADPDYAINHFVYLYYTTGSNCASSTGRFNRVGRFILDGERIDRLSETVLLSNIGAYGGNHDGGALEIGQDGYLYVGIGDAGTNPRAPHGASSANTAATDLSLLNGKIVRITTDGGIPPDNPFSNDPAAVSCATAGTAAPTNGKCREIFAWGLRNPYRFAFDPNSGNTHFFINDVGLDTTEEVDEGGLGLNYGWPSREGGCATGSTTNCGAVAGLTNPITTYTHDGVCEYVTAGAFVPNGVWPHEFDGSYLFADGGCGKMWRRTVGGTVDYATPFGQTSGGIVDMEFQLHGAEPALYYVTVGSSQLRKITYDAPASLPSAAMGYSALASPNRVYDTRYNVGIPPGRVRGSTTRLVNIGIADSTIKAALVNLTMTGTSGDGFAVAYQPRTTHPPTSNVNALSGETVANASIVPVDGDGNIVVYTSITTDLVVDVMGVFRETPSATTGGRYQTLSPRRLIDTREPANEVDNVYKRSNVPPRTDLVVSVGGRLGVPTSATAVAVILTALSGDATVPGFATAYPGGSVLPTSSNINVNGFQDIRANLVIVPLGSNGTIQIRGVNVADVLVDVAGYFTNASGGAGMYHLLSPTRQIETRPPFGAGRVPAGGTISLNPAFGVPDTASAVSQNVTLTDNLGGGWLTAYPSDEPKPLASNINVTADGQTRAALAFTKVGANGAGSISYYTAGATQVVVDITGYFDR